MNAQRRQYLEDIRCALDVGIADLRADVAAETHITKRGDLREELEHACETLAYVESELSR